jgi:hypothetical protein
MVKTKVLLNDVTETREYLRTALELVEELEPPDDLRVAFFTTAVNLVSQAQVFFEQHQIAGNGAHLLGR